MESEKKTGLELINKIYFNEFFCQEKLILQDYIKTYQSNSYEVENGRITP